MSKPFTIYYADGGSFGSDDGAWDDAPVDGVLVVVLKDGDITRFYSGNDFYAMLGQEKGEDTIAETADIGSVLRQYCPWIKHGVWTTHKNFERTMNRAKKEWT